MDAETNRTVSATATEKMAGSARKPSLFSRYTWLLTPSGRVIGRPRTPSGEPGGDGVATGGDPTPPDT
ncbi:hypothetical protein GCM10022205_16460 [Spinactinospora alkalitolerans]